MSLPELTTIKVPKQTAELLRIYSIFKQRKVVELTTSILEKELGSFKERLAELKQV